MFFSRIIDMHNEKVFRVRLSPDEIRRVNERVGYATMFPYLQPENCRFALDMAYPDQRLVCSFLVRLEEKEKPGNIQEYEMHYVDGQVDRLEMGIPRSWAEIDSLPSEGVFQCFYNCAPDDRRFEYRRKFAESATFCTMNVVESNVSWWASLKEAPVDVLELLSWLVGKFPNMNKVFRALTGSSDPDKTFNLRQLEDFLAQQGCKKFDGPDQHSRIAAVFRYLDPGREGTVSKHEFKAMEKLWKEMDLCIREFTFFVCHVFGEDFEELWLALDEDSSGTLTLEEWLSACEHVGYFGPADIVFKFIDSDDDGVIQFEELGVLETAMNTVTKRKSRASFGGPSQLPPQDMTRPLSPQDMIAPGPDSRRRTVPK
jgi:Ca2+-binding EF-hand superfamily protein